MAEVV